MSSISLTASMRSNLLSLQQTASLMSQTQERLSSGKKVNSAIDNPSSYYTAQSLSNRANDLSGLLDSMGQAISTIKAANEGIEAITSFVEQAKAVATSALDTTDGASRKDYMDQFNAILGQIDKLAKDSGYKGINLLQDDDLTVTFNESRTNQLKIEGVKADTSADGLNIAEAAWGIDKGASSAANVIKADGTPTTAITAEQGTNGIVVKSGDDYYLYKGDAVAADAKIDLSGARKLVEVGTKVYDFTATGTGGVAEKIQASIEKATMAIEKLRGYASAFGNNYSIVQTRESFTTNLINVLEEGADKLTLADMNEESANMLALQTRQQLAINSLSLASQAAQSVLKLF